MTEKENSEMMSLRNRIRCQKDEINRLLEENTMLKMRIKYNESNLETLRTRCHIGAEKYFDNHQYGLLKIVTVQNKGAMGEMEQVVK